MYTDEKVQQQEATKHELSSNTTFMWEVGPEWQGMNQDEIRKLYSEVGAALDIKPDEASRIEAFFGDHIVVQQTERNYINSASCIPDSDDTGNIEGCRLIFNRSLELANYVIALDEEKEEAQTEGINCIFQDPRENLIWLLAEELGHARITLKAGTEERDANWQRNYEQILANKEITSQDKYRENLQEVTVSRNAVKVLKKFFPARADYYQELYDESVKQNKQIVPNVSEVVEQTYIPTGFKP